MESEYWKKRREREQKELLEKIRTENDSSGEEE